MRGVGVEGRGERRREKKAEGKRNESGLLTAKV